MCCVIEENKQIILMDTCSYNKFHKYKQKKNIIIAGHPQVSDQIPHGPGEGSGICTHRSHHDSLISLLLYLYLHLYLKEAGFVHTGLTMIVFF